MTVAVNGYSAERAREAPPGPVEGAGPARHARPRVRTGLDDPGHVADRVPAAGEGRVVELVPVDGHGHGRTRLGAHRPGGHRGLGVVVAVPVDIHAVPPLRLVWFDRVVVGLAGHHGPGDALGQRRHLV